MLFSTRQSACSCCIGNSPPLLQLSPTVHQREAAGPLRDFPPDRQKVTDSHSESTQSEHTESQREGCDWLL